ncbi:MAG TPA: nuclear transport factor 2 family protein, partial [Chitinophagaceae bacterium]
MTIDAIASRLVALCRQGKYEEAQTELYSNDAESLEPREMPGMESVKGLDGIKKKGERFNEMVEAIHGGSVSDPVIAGNKFAISLIIDATMKGMGRQSLEEICVYTVKDGKIVKEQ